MRSAAFRVIPDVATTSGLSGHSSEGTTDNDPNDLTATATDTDTATATGSDETATATDLALACLVCLATCMHIAAVSRRRTKRAS